jgi:hypothetical protein
LKPKGFVQGNNIDHPNVSQEGFQAFDELRKPGTPDQFGTEAVLRDSPICVFSLQNFILEQDILLLFSLFC